MGDWIYYINRIGADAAHDNAGYLFTMRLDGKDRPQICDDSSKDINVINYEWICYGNVSHNNELWMVSTNGSIKRQVFDGSSCHYNVVGDWVFYSSIETGYLYKRHITGAQSGQCLVAAPHPIGNINIVGDWVYYTLKIENNPIGAVCKININGEPESMKQLTDYYEIPPTETTALNYENDEVIESLVEIAIDLKEQEENRTVSEKEIRDEFLSMNKQIVGSWEFGTEFKETTGKFITLDFYDNNTFVKAIYNYSKTPPEQIISRGIYQVTYKKLFLITEENAIDYEKTITSDKITLKLGSVAIAMLGDYTSGKTELDFTKK
jgi:hypothetical protein